MRKQYHFRPSAAGLCAWDVDELIRLAADLEEEDLPLESVTELDEDWWFAHGPTPTVRNVVEHMLLVQQADLSFPIVIDPDGRVMDGMHRVAKALSLGHSSVRARRLPALPAPHHVGVRPEDLSYDRQAAQSPASEVSGGSAGG